jgi:dimethyladenosine transferase 2
MYRSTTILFQLLFEHEFLEKLPRQNFLPWQSDYKLSSHLKLTKFNLVDPDYMYLVKIVPRKEFFQFCQPQNLQALWFFVKQNFVSRKNRVIPALERWIPGSGPRLIVNRKPSEAVKKLNLDTNSSKIPIFSESATTISNQNFIDNMNIFTQFGDLTPSQVLTIFDEFTNWPEFKECPFVASMENSLMKLETTPDESTDNLDLQEVDDLEIPESSKKDD